MSSDKPVVDIFDFKTPHEYLQAAFEALQKQHGRRQSLRAISKRYGIRSVATLSMVLSGKRKITTEVADKLIQILKLKGVQRRYFLTLVELEKNSDVQQRAELEERLLALRQMGESRSLNWKQYQFLSEWHYVALFVMVGQPDFKLDHEYLSKRLKRRISPKQVEEAIANMLSLGLISEQNGKLIQTHGPILKTEEDIKNLSVRKFQRAMMKKGLEALFSPVTQREITGVTMGIPKKSLPEVKRRIRQFREEIDEFACSQGDADEVFQLNIQFFPLTAEAEKCGG